MFVGNRVNEIRPLTVSSQWLHMLSQLNPADLACQGCTPRQIVHSLWWDEPHWLKGQRERWPVLEINHYEKGVHSKHKKSATLVTSVTINKPKWFEKFSKFSRVVRVLA